MAWMVNLNSIKTDVYNPFDKQKLVWTGLYEEIQNVNLKRVATHISEADVLETANYYDGTAQSPFIYVVETHT